MIRLTDHLDMTIAVDWDGKPQNKQNKNLLNHFFYQIPDVAC